MGGNKRSYNKAILGLTAALTLFIGQQQSAPAAPSRKIWRIDYESYGSMLTGRTRVYLSDKAIKIETGMYEVTASAPDWTAVIYSKTLNAYAVRPASKWQKEGFLLDSAESDDYMDPKAVLSSQKVIFQGLPAMKMTWKGVEMDQFYLVRQKSQACTTELYQTTALPVTKMQLDAIGMWYGVPHISGVPLLVQNVLPHKMFIKLRVLSLKSVPNTVSFKPRTTGRKVASTMDLIKGRYGAEIENMLFDTGK